MKNEFPKLNNLDNGIEDEKESQVENENQNDKEANFKKENNIDIKNEAETEKPLNNLLNNESFEVSYENRAEIEEYFSNQPGLKERLKTIKENINPGIFSAVTLGLKIFLISKMIGGPDVQAQVIKDVNQKNTIENSFDVSDHKTIPYSTFVINQKNIAELQEEKERQIVAAYLKKIGMDNVNFHTESSEIFGQHSKIYKEYRKFASDNPAFLRFGAALYSGQFRLNDKRQDMSEATNKMILQKDSVAANKIAEELYIDFCKKNNLDPAKQIYFNNSYGGSLQVDRLDDIQFAFVSVGQPMTSEEYYSPPYVTVIHELNHLQRRYKQMGERRIGDKTEEALDEIATRLHEIINKDYIYKKINNIPLEEEVEYAERINCDNNQGLSIGLASNTFRKLLEQYETMEECLMSSEGQEFVRKYYKNKK